MQPAKEFDPKGWHTEKPHVKCCKMPRTICEKEAEVSDLLLTSHCEHPDKKSANHECCGAITISRNAIVLRCKKCGDAKATWQS